MKVKYLDKKIKVQTLSFLSTLLSAAIPFLVQRLIDSISSGLFDIKLVIIILMAIPVRKLFDFLFNYGLNNIFAGATSDKRTELVHSILGSSSTNTYKIDTNTLNNRLMNEAYSFGSIDGTRDIMIFGNIVMLTVSTLVLLRINIYIFLSICIIIPLIYLVTSLIKKDLQKVSAEVRVEYERTSFCLKEICSGFGDIKMMSAEKQMEDRFSAANKKLFKAEKHYNFINRLSTDCYDILFSILPILSLVFGLILSYFDKCNVSTSVAFYMYLNFFIEPITNLTQFKVQMITARERKKLIEEKMSEFDKPAGSIKDAECSSLSLKTIKHTYDKTVINYNCTKQIDNAGLYYFSGKSGSGKSTILKIASRLVNSPESDILLDGIKINQIDENAFFGKITYLGNIPYIFNGTVAQNISMFDTLKIGSDEIDAMFDSSENIHLDTNLDTKDSIPLSTGQIQRVNILRLLNKQKMHNQEIVILDESLSGVDETREEKILEYLKAEFSQSIIIIVSHRATTRAICDYSIETVENNINVTKLNPIYQI